MDAFYRKDVDEAQRKGLWMLSAIADSNRDLRRVKRYQGLIPNLDRLLGISESTSNHLKPVARLLFDNIKLRWDDTDCRDAAGITDTDIKRSKRARDRAAASMCCRMCKGTRINYS